MININIAAIPNQSLSVQLGGFVWDITLKETIGTMSATVVRDGITLVQNQRIAPGTPLLPYSYLESGNFLFLTNAGDYPYYTQFGLTQSLVFATQEEINAIQGT